MEIRKAKADKGMKLQIHVIQVLINIRKELLHIAEKITALIKHNTSSQVFCVCIGGCWSFFF